MAAEGMPFPWRLNRSTISANVELIWEISVILDNIAEFLGPMMGVGVAEITVIVVAVIIVLWVLMLFAVFGLKPLLRQLAEEPAARDEALLEEFRKITLALHEDAKRSESRANSPAKDNTRPPPVTPLHPSLKR